MAPLSGLDLTARARERLWAVCARLGRVANWGGAAMHVSLSVLEKALRFVEDLAETGDPADLGARALPGLERLVRCDILSYNEFGPQPGQISYCAWPTGLAFSPASLAAFEAHVDQNPLLAHQRATGDDGPVKISDFLTRDRFHRLALYAEFYRHLPVE